MHLLLEIHIGYAEQWPKPDMAKDFNIVGTRFGGRPFGRSLGENGVTDEEDESKEEISPEEFGNCHAIALVVNLKICVFVYLCICVSVYLAFRRGHVASPGELMYGFPAHRFDTETLAS